MATDGDHSDTIYVDANESSPLLHRKPIDADIRGARARSSSESSLSPSSPSSTENSMKKAQLTMICFMRLMDPINFSQLFPYINEYVAFLGVTKEVEQVGFYSGLVDSVFAAAQFLLLYQWSSWSDRIGRRPIILAGSIGLALSTIWFGASDSFLQLMIFRALAGIFGGATSVVQSVLGELTTKENQAPAFAWYGVMWPVGTILGPLIGGLFSNPADQFELFQNSTILKRYPYLLPCLVCGALQLLATIMLYVGVEETLPAKRSKRLEDGPSPRLETEALHNQAIDANTRNESDSSFKPNLGLKDLLSLPIIRDLTFCGFALDVNGTSFAIVFALFCYSPIEHGGLAFPPTTIGYIFALTGVVGGLMQVIALPPLLHRFEAANVFTATMACWPCAFAVLPFLNAIAAHGLDSTGSLDGAYLAYLWLGIFLVVLLSRLGGMSYSLLMLLTKENVPNPTVLGATNGLVQCSMCLARSISAIASSAAFAYSQKYHVLGGYFWALLLAFFGMLGVLSSYIASSHSRSTL